MTGEPGKPTKHGRAACFPKPYRSLAILQLIRCLNPAADPRTKGQAVPPSWCSRADLGLTKILKTGFRPGLCFQIWNYNRKDSLTWADKLTFFASASWESRFAWGLHELSSGEGELILLCPSWIVLRATTRNNEWPIQRPFGGISGIIWPSARPLRFQVTAWITVICSGRNFRHKITWPL